MTNKDLLYRTGNYTQYLIITCNGKESDKQHIYICLYVCVYVKVAHSCLTLCNHMDSSLPPLSVEFSGPECWSG